jgi:hypothetical protein
MNKASRTAQHQAAQPWTPHDIDAARSADLAPILAQRGYTTTTLPNGAVLLRNYRGLIIHANRWTWKCERLHGNTIDFFVTLEGKTFSQAMAIVTDACNDNPDDASDDDL